MVNTGVVKPCHWKHRGSIAGTTDYTFLLVASFSFAKGSDRFHRWFTGTKLYKKHLEDFVTDRAMTLKTKFGILLPASAMLIIAMLLVPSIHFRIFIVFLIIFKYVYFFTKIKTIKGAVEVD